MQSAKCRKKEGRDNEHVVLPTGIFSTEMRQRERARKRVDLRKEDERGRDGGDEKCGGYIWNTSFGFLISSSSVERTTFRDILSLPIPSNLGGKKKVKQVFLTSCILFATKLLFREYFEGLTPPCNNLLSCYSEEETLV